MKLDFNLPLTNLKDEIMKNPDGSTVNLNELLGNALVSTTGKENIIKVFDWALTLQKTGILDLDRADQDTLIKMIKDSDNLSVLSKGRLLKVADKKVEDKLKVK